MENIKNSIIGTCIKVTIDRPLGSCHPKYPDLYYPINYGYVDGVIAPDGEEQDAYVLGVNEPLNEFCGRVIAVIHRLNDVEDKWVVAPDGYEYTAENIEKAVNFQEKYFKHQIFLQKNKKI